MSGGPEKAGEKGAGLRSHPEGLALTLKVVPGAKASRIDGWEEDADRSPLLRLRVSAAPEKGKANGAVLKLLAKSLGLPAGRLRVLSGQTGRTKVVLIEDAQRQEGGALTARLEAAARKK